MLFFRGKMNFDLRTKKCPSCGVDMMVKANYGVFPIGCKHDQIAQMSERDVKFISKSKIGEDLICVQCESEGKAAFTCALCGKMKSSDKIKETIGDPADHLCEDCYSTVSALVWDQKIENLNRQHQWDFM
jgi:hypothetical protein